MTRLMGGYYECDRCHLIASEPAMPDGPADEDRIPKGWFLSEGNPVQHYCSHECVMPPQVMRVEDRRKTYRAPKHRG